MIAVDPEMRVIVWNRGRTVSVRVVASPLWGRNGVTEGAILVLEENRGLSIQPLSISAGGRRR